MVLIQEIFIGLIVAAIIAVLAILRKSILYYAKRLLRTFLKKLILPGSIHESFKNWDDANTDISKEMNKSNKLYILASRGNFLISDDDNNPYIRYMNDKSKKIRILLPDIHDRCKKQNWIHQRVTEMQKLPDTVITEDSQLIHDIESVIKIIKNVVLFDGHDKSRSIAYFDSLHIGKIILLNEVGYFQPYFKEIKGEDGVVYKYEKSTYMYRWLSRLVDNTCEFAVPINETNHACNSCVSRSGGTIDA